ncbi:MAG: helix-turn-helix transcriptional regulator [Fibrobacteres bacterium]|nr:helix-turn-helix transcriptional regulator [Fibrobacterota bacterium]
MKQVYHFPLSSYRSSEIIRPTSIAHEIISDINYRWNERRMGIRSGYYFIQYTLRGAGRFTTGGESKEAVEGMAFLCHVDTPFEYWFDPALSKEWEFIWLGMTGISGEPIVKKIQNEFGSLFHLERKGLAVSTLFDFHKKAAKGQWMDFRDMSVACYDFLMILIDELRSRGSTGSTDRIEEALRYFNDHYKESLQLKELSGEFGYSAEHFSRLFRKRTGLSPVQYLHSIRLERVKSLLRTTSYNLDRIASESGLNNANYLCRLFKQTFELSPGEYRESKERDLRV